MRGVTLGRDLDGPTVEVARFNQALQEIAPRDDGGENPRVWYFAYWEPGDWWGPLERIVVAKMIPRRVFVAEDRFYRSMGAGSDASRFSELEGPNPRWGGHYDSVLQQWVPASWRPEPTITERQWLLWRQEHALAVPVWIVEGEQGGHPRKYSVWERELRRVRRQEKQPPAPGSLPYAQPDTRTLAGLREHILAQQISETVDPDWFTRDEATYTPAEHALMREFTNWQRQAADDRAHGRTADLAYDAERGEHRVITYGNKYREDT